MDSMTYGIPLFRLLILLFFLFFGGEALLAQDVPDRKLLFIENKGQIIDQFGNPNPEVRFLLNMKGFNVQLRQNGFSYDIYQIEKEGQKHEGTEEQGNNYLAPSIQHPASGIRHPASLSLRA